MLRSDNTHNLLGKIGEVGLLFQSNPLHALFALHAQRPILLYEVKKTEVNHE